jgi:Bacterial PH domain
MKRYLSTKNIFTISILWITVAIMLILLILGIRRGDLGWFPIVALSLVISLIIWTLLDTRYVIKNGNLLYRSGPFRGRINIQTILKIQKFSGLNPPVTFKPALDYNGFIITFNESENVYVSPKMSDIFISELLKINPKIIIQS